MNGKRFSGKYVRSKKKSLIQEAGCNNYGKEEAQTVESRCLHSSTVVCVTSLIFEVKLKSSPDVDDRKHGSPNDFSGSTTTTMLHQIKN